MEAKFWFSVIPFFSLFFAIYAKTTLTPNYDNVEHKIVTFGIREALILMCEVEGGEDFDLTWTKNGTNVNDLDSLKDRFHIIDDEKKFMIDKSRPGDDGLYTCAAAGTTMDINVVARVSLKVIKDITVTEEDEVSIPCSAYGTNPRLTWTVNNLDLKVSNDTDRYKIVLDRDEEDTHRSTLIIEKTTFEDRGFFTCTGVNAANDYTGALEESGQTYLRVKSKYVFIWPTLCIIIELIAFIAMMFICENRRRRRLQEHRGD